MKKIKIKQPFASMVICGAFQTIPNLWENVLHGETIYIYAEGVDESFYNGFDLKNEIHKSIWNEMSFGNIPDGVFPNDVFLGCVSVNQASKSPNHWGHMESIVYVSDPCTFFHPIENFDISFTFLESQRKRRTTLKRMWVDDDVLMIPVCQNMFENVCNIKRYQSVFFFWKSYFNSLFSSFSLDKSVEKPGDYLSTAVFYHGNKNIRFECSGIGFSIDSEYGFICIIEPEYIDHGNTLEKIPIDNPARAKQEVKKKSQYVRFISVPMGGMKKRW